MSTAEAPVIQSALRAHGLYCEVGNIHHAQMDWLAIPALGGLDIRVPHTEADAARDCLIELKSSANERLEEEWKSALNAATLNRPRWPVWLIAFLAFGSALTFMLANAAFQFLNNDRRKT